MERTDNTSGVRILRQELVSMEKRHMEQNYSEHSEKRGGGISTRIADTVWSKQMVEGAV